MIKIKSQTQFDEISSHITWEDAFVKEIYCVSPSYIHDNGAIIASNSAPAVLLNICTPYDEHLGIEFFF